MAQKVVIGLLVVTIIGAFLIGIYDSVQPSLASDTVAEEVAQVPTVSPTATAEIVVEPITSVEVVQSTGGTTPVQQSLASVGDPWATDGIVTALDDFGMTLELPDGSSVYVELGPPSFWQAQGGTLAVNDSVFVDGFSNGEQVHAATVTLPDGTQLTLRNATGQPLWSGGAGGGNVQGQSEPLNQVNPEDWVTISGVITTVTNSSVTLQTADGPMTVQLGQQRFWQNQGVSLAVGDEVSVLGIWQSSQFQVAEITNLQTGDRIMLRDPNGRPLWAGPGSNTQSNSNGGNGQGNGGSGQGNGGNGNSGNGQGNGGNGQGNGNGYRGGRGS
ncbi:MAG: hypothetical protein K8L99_18645 [Anaerolineae bacterium]|nr:hypothetical protein [Anaerolineae bacterium]